MAFEFDTDLEMGKTDIPRIVYMSKEDDVLAVNCCCANSVLHQTAHGLVTKPRRWGEHSDKIDGRMLFVLLIRSQLCSPLDLCMMPNPTAPVLLTMTQPKLMAEDMKWVLGKFWYSDSAALCELSVLNAGGPH